MARSMTGFGSCEVAASEYKITVELKSVNHRYCDVSIKMPKKLNFFENTIRTQIKKFASRGKIDIFISYEDYTEGKLQITYNSDIAASYLDGMAKISDDFVLENHVDAYQVACFPEVFKVEDQQLDEEKIQSLIAKALDGAGAKFVANREAEGERLKADLLKKLDELLNSVSEIEARSPQILEEHREKLMTKIRELLGDRNIEENILVSELVVFADKICVDEEAVRLHSHVINMKDTLNETDSIGRKLDFIAQEMNREANTILSKANDLEISNHAINLKTLIEKIREQIQNIE